MNNLISLNKITKFFFTNKKILVLNKISLKLSKGKIYSIVGPSGSGKSTLLNILSMIDKPSSGSLSIGKKNINFNRSSDKKSEYTGGHCERVPEICMMLAEAVEKADYGKYKDFKMTSDERYELYIAAWLHDCGKVATPVHVVDKSTKLETITDRIEVVNTRFELIKRDIENKFLQQSLKFRKHLEHYRNLENALEISKKFPAAFRNFHIF